MAKKIWKIKLDKKDHSVEFRTGGFRSMPVIQVDGKPVETEAVQKTSRFPMFSDYRTEFKKHQLLVRMTTNGFFNTYDLAVDELSVVTGEPFPVGHYIPSWCWPFFVACIVVTFLDLNNFILSLVALVTGFGCIAISSDPQRRFALKMGSCVAFTAIAWIVYLFMR